MDIKHKTMSRDFGEKISETFNIGKGHGFVVLKTNRITVKKSVFYNNELFPVFKKII